MTERNLKRPTESHGTLMPHADASQDLGTCTRWRRAPRSTRSTAPATQFRHLRCPANRPGQVETALSALLQMCPQLQDTQRQWRDDAEALQEG